MRIPIRLTTIALIVLSLVGSNNTSTSSAGRSVAPMPPGPRSVTAQGATKFSSAYTALTKCGSGMTKKEEKEAEEQGQDIPTRCKGYGGYDIYIYYSACSSNFSVDRKDENISLGMQAIDWKQKTVEWRMAQVDGKAKPFALIMRVYEYGGSTECATGGKITGESLIVKGLKGYEHIDATVQVKGTPNANLKAREIADKGFAQPKP